MTIQTKLKVDDKAFFLADNVVCTGKVTKVVVEVEREGRGITTTIKYHTDSAKTPLFGFPEHLVHASKEILLAAL